MANNNKEIVAFDDDMNLIKSVAIGNKKAFEVLTKRHMPIIYSVAFRMNFTKSDAEDISQEVMLKIWVNAGKWDVSKKAKVSTWIYQITYNLCIDMIRKQKHNFSDETIQLVDKSDNAEQKYMNGQHSDNIQGLINNLPERQRMALVFAYYQELSYVEISTIMDSSVKSIESLLVRAKKNLRIEAKKSNLLEGDLR